MTAPLQFLKKRDGVILLVLLAGCLLAMWGMHEDETALTLRISVDGNVVREVPLDSLSDGCVSLPEAEGVTLRVQDGAICVEEADCPDQRCVRMGWIDAPGEMIVCLPHRLLITLTAQTPNEPEVDVIVG